MKKRLDGIRRIQAVQKKLRDLAEARLAELDRRASALTAARSELICALNEDQTLHGLFLDSMARRVRKLSTSIAHLETVREAQAKVLLEHNGKLKLAERMAGAVARDHKATIEKQDLAELIDRLKPARASLP